MRYLSFLFAIALSFLLAACGGGGGSPGTVVGGSSSATGTPTLSLEIFDVNGAATTSIGASGLVTAKATLKDKRGNLVAGSRVTFSGDSALITISPALDALTDASGVATVQLSAASGVAAGAGSLSASTVLTGTAVSANKDYQLAPLQLSLSNLDVGTSALPAYGNRPVSVLATINGIVATKTPVQVTFTASCGTVSPAVAMTDGAGKAGSTYTADSTACAGSNVTISVSSAGATPLAATLAVQAPQVTNLQFVSAAPQLIFLVNSVGATRSLVTFKVLDSIGNPLGNHAVQISLLNSAPGVSLGTVGNAAALTQTSNALGLVSVSVFSGTVPTSVQVRAASVASPSVRADSNVLTVATGVPVQQAASLAVSKFSIEGMNVDGQTASFTISLADRVGNPVPDGTQVNFVTSAGVMIPPTCVVSGGSSSCSSILRSQGTRPVNGRVAVMAYVPGEEDFVDSNGNNMYDAGESFTDVGSAHLDANFNGVYDDGEFTVPRAGSLSCPPGLNGRPNTCDGVWGGIDVRRQAMVVFASSTPIFGNVTTVPSSQTIGTVTVAVVTSISIDVADLNGNSMPTGTLVQGDAFTGGTPPGVSARNNCTVAATQPSTIGNIVGPTRVTFTLTSCFVGVGDRISISTTSPGGVVSTPRNVPL